MNQFKAMQNMDMMNSTCAVYPRALKTEWEMICMDLES